MPPAFHHKFSQEQSAPENEYKYPIVQRLGDSNINCNSLVVVLQLSQKIPNHVYKIIIDT